MTRVRHATAILLAGFASAPVAATAQGTAAGTRQSAETVTQTVADAADATGDIVVTATRRAQNLQDIPIAITAVSGEALQNQKITSLLDIQGLVPGLQVARNNAAISFTLRGVGSNFRVQGVDTTVAVHTDGVYISSPNAIQASLFDIDRIEVVKGPQGVLYGRNASGGAINLISRLPTSDLSGYAQATYGNYQDVEVEAAVSGPIVQDRILVRIAGFFRDRGGYGRNFTLNQDNNDLHEYGAKATVQLKPSDNFQIIVRGDYYRGNDHSQGTDALPGSAPGRPKPCLPSPALCLPGKTLAESRGGIIAPNPRDTYANIATERDLRVWGVSGEVTLDVTDNIALKSLTGYRYVDSFQQLDQDQTQLSVNDPFVQTVKGGQFSQELQASYRSNGVYAILGGYYFDERRDVFFKLQFPALSFLPPPNYRDVAQIGYTQTKAYAAFGNVDIDVTSKFTLGLGARYSSEKRGTAGFNVAIFGPGVTLPLTERTFNAFTPRVTLDYKLTPDLTAYASVSKGFKSGQFGVAVAVPAEPEFLWDYEGGLKGRILDGAIRFSLGGFYYDFKNVQLQLFNGPVNVITNAPAGVAYGGEATIDIRLPAAFRLHVDALLEHSEYKGLITDNPNTGQAKVDLSGNRFPYTPTFSYNVALEKDFELGRLGTGTLRIEDQYNSKTYLDIYQNEVNGFRPSYHIVNVSYRQQFTDHLSLQLWAKNLTNIDRVMASNFGIGPVGNTRLVNFNAPRTYGVTLRGQF
jgi:iron complex outermembrane recepter protein